MIRRILKWFGFLMIGLVVIISVIYVSLANSVGKSAIQRTFFMQRKPPPLVIAHRGGAGLFPENTLYAFEHSWKLGADVLELDVRETSDGKLVVMHDAKVDRTTDGNGLITEMSLESVKKLNAGYNFSTDSGQTFRFREH